MTSRPSATSKHTSEERALEALTILGQHRYVEALNDPLRQIIYDEVLADLKSIARKFTQKPISETTPQQRLINMASLQIALAIIFSEVHVGLTLATLENALLPEDAIPDKIFPTLFDHLSAVLSDTLLDALKDQINNDTQEFLQKVSSPTP